MFVSLQEKMKCIYCGSASIRVWSSKKGMFRCKDCGRCFTKDSNPLRGVIKDNGRYCLKCGEFKDNGDFFFKKGKPRSICKKCYGDSDNNSRFSNRGVTRQVFDDMIKNQLGKCAICGKILDSPKKSFIDHDHRSGVIRGILCPSCNTMIGLSNDNPDILSKAIKYLLSFV